MSDILIIDDDEFVGESISSLVRQLGHKAVYSPTLADGLSRARTEPFDLVFLDVRLPDGSGLDILPQLRATGSCPEIIILTGFGDPDGAELAIRNGAWDYIEKPSSLQSIKLPLLRALEYRKEKKEDRARVSLKRPGIIGNCQKIGGCLDLLAEASGSDVNVLITGETGTGKELFASAIHRNSDRALRNFVVVDCAALPETLVESVLFGHKKGAFTGADKSEDGLVKQADRGTLFLDEIGELSMSIQKSFLRVLQERRFRPVGEAREIPSDFRLVAATNRDLEAMAKEGRFRSDLLFRLRTLVINLPPLRECPEDIQDLTVYYVNKLCERFGREVKGYSPEFMEVLRSYAWPGNVRELIQALEKALVSAKDDPILYPRHLPDHVRIQVAQNVLRRKTDAGDSSAADVQGFSPTLPLQEVRDAAIFEAERKYFRDILGHTAGNVTEACRISGLSRSRFYSLLKKYRLPGAR